MATAATMTRTTDSTDRPGEDRRPPTRPVQIGERRRAPRTVVVKQCKIFHRRLARFVGAETTNVSSTGLLIRIDRARPVMVGDEIQVAVAWDRRVQMLPSHSLRAGRVVRVLPIDHHHQAIAVAFEDVHSCADGESTPVAGRIQERPDARDEVADQASRAA
jgi:hypothetical protein